MESRSLQTRIEGVLSMVCSAEGQRVVTTMTPLVLVVLLIAAAPPGNNDDMIKQEIAKLQGRWTVNSAEYAGEKFAVEKDKLTWQFVGDRVTRYIGSKKVQLLRFEIQASGKQNDVDLISIRVIPSEKEAMPFVGRTRCIYSLDGDELKVAYSADLSVTGPESEKQRAIQLAKIRPRSFDTARGDVMVFTLTRQKRGKPK